MEEGYDVGQVCLNGHAANPSAASMPQFSQVYCSKCGEATITACAGCSTPIRGRYHCPGFISAAPYQPPAYCYKCGNSFPWTERKIRAAVDLATEDGALTEEETQKLEETVKDVVRDTPHTQVAANRFKRVLAKVGRGTASAIRDVLVDIVGEAAKKTIWGK